MNFLVVICSSKIHKLKAVLFLIDIILSSVHVNLNIHLCFRAVVLLLIFNSKQNLTMFESVILASVARTDERRFDCTLYICRL